ncbi:MAG: ribosomal RNA small subunit methyltransferase A [Candidatus Omnitrophica bacterium]|nr:ribosomal RNA small subunit methyltransferase A [Candidatus Omnitrophota bacterium]
MFISELKDIWRETGFYPNKKLGQNFLIDANIRNNILKLLEFGKESTVLEIGPGFGMMTFAIAEMCKKVYAIEKDKKICDAMKGRFEEKKNITLVPADILHVDFRKFAGENDKLIVYGNIPYSITSPIIEKIFTERKYVDKAYLVMQEEYADRLAARPGSKDYSSITCFAQYFSLVKKIMRIRSTAFLPRPAVNSFLVGIILKGDPYYSVDDEHVFFKIIRKSFNQRRKKISNSLSDGDFLGIPKNTWCEMIVRSGINLFARAEDISLSQYATLANNVSKYLGRGA